MDELRAAMDTKVPHLHLLCCLCAVFLGRIAIMGTIRTTRFYIAV